MDLQIIKTISEAHAGIVTLSILVLLLAALIGAKLASFLQIPKVAGEILGGLVAGPTVLGYFSPETYNFIFRSFETQGPVISVFYWLGLILLMFSSGYESDMDDFKNDKKIVSWLVAGSTILPMLAGYWISDRYFASRYIGTAENIFVFNIIFAIAAAVTSLPVISKIFMDLGLIKHRYARIILTTATIQDLFLWVVLSVAGSIVTKAKVIPFDILLHIAVTLLMFSFAMFVAPQLSRVKWLDRLAVFSYDSIYFILCFACIYIGSLFGVNIMYSAFVAGLIFKNIRTKEAIRAQIKIKDICFAFFTPVYFAIVGLRIHLTSNFSVPTFISFIIVVSVLELVGCVIAMKLIRLDWLTSFNLGIAMNARGGPGIVLATITYEMGIVNYEFFCVLIFTSLITSAAAGWWIDYVNRQGKLLTL